MATTVIHVEDAQAANQPPASGAATPDFRNAIPVLDFDDAGTETAEFGFIVPTEYGGGAMTGIVGWMATDTTVGPDDARIALAFKSVADDADDLDTKAYASNILVTSTEASASGEVKYASFTISNAAADAIAAGEYGRLRFQRIGADGADDLAGDLELLFIKITED